MSKKGSWIRYHHFVCPICGYVRVTKDYVTDKPKPKEYYYRHITVDYQYHCNFT